MRRPRPTIAYSRTPTFLEVTAGGVEGVLAFEFGPKRDLEQLGGGKATTFQLFV